MNLNIPIGSIDVSGITPASLLAQLCNNAKPKGMGFMNCTGKLMSESDADTILSDSKDKFFDYLNGCPIKTNFKYYPIMSAGGYDRDHGPGAFQKCVDDIKKTRT
jgi:hypothetical protein